MASLLAAAAECVGQSDASFVESRWTKHRDASAKRRSGERVEVVERNDAVLFEPITKAQPQFRRQPADRRCQTGHDDGVDTVGDGVACEDQNRTISAPSDIGKPDLAPFHWLNISAQSVSSSGHASFGHAADSAGVSGRMA